MTITTSVVLVDDLTPTRTAVAGFLAGYCGATRRSYATDLRIFADWCGEANLELFAVRRAHLELFGRWMEETGAFLVQAGLGSARDHALASLLALNGLRISEALGADIDDLDYERGHRTLKIFRKGGKHAVIPLAPRTSRALDLYIGERTTGAVFVGARARRVAALGEGCSLQLRRQDDRHRAAGLNAVGRRVLASAR